MSALSTFAPLAPFVPHALLTGPRALCAVDKAVCDAAQREMGLPLEGAADDVRTPRRVSRRYLA